MKKISLTEAKGKQIKILDDLIEVEVKKGDPCIVGKLHIDRIIKKVVLKITMSKIW